LKAITEEGNLTPRRKDFAGDFPRLFECIDRKVSCYLGSSSESEFQKMAADGRRSTQIWEKGFAFQSSGSCVCFDRFMFTPIILICAHLRPSAASLSDACNDFFATLRPCALALKFPSPDSKGDYNAKTQRPKGAKILPIVSQAFSLKGRKV
jgi:hypothetical protein